MISITLKDLQTEMSNSYGVVKIDQRQGEKRPAFYYFTVKIKER
jgi:hypothetical protein